MSHKCLLVGSLMLVCSVSALSAGSLRPVDDARAGDFAALRAVVNPGNVNLTQGDRSTALHWAVYWNNGEAATLLIRAGAKVNATNDLGVSPLWVAATNGSLPMIQILLKAGANPNLASASGITPLMKAVRAGSLDAVQALLKGGAQVDAKESAHGQTALMWASAERHATIVKALIDAGASVKARSATWSERVLLCCQAYNGDAREELENTKQGGLTPLLFVATEGDLDSAKALLAAGANVDEADSLGETALAVAVRSDNAAVARLLIDSGANPNSDSAGFTPLHAAVLRNDLEVVNALLDHGANPNARLERATPARRESRDYAFNANWIGATPIWLAAAFHESKIMETIAAHGADINAAAADGSTPLIAAAIGENELLGQVVPRVIPENGAPLELIPGPGVERGTLEAVRTAVNLGANVNAANRDGDTALHILAKAKFSSVVEYLVQNHAALDVRNNAGLSPLMVAMMKRTYPFGTFGREEGFEIVTDAGQTAQLLRKLGATE